VGGASNFGYSYKDQLIRSSAENGKELLRKRIKTGR
jgi:hypothetical protein